MDILVEFLCFLLFGIPSSGIPSSDNFGWVLGGAGEFFNFETCFFGYSLLFCFFCFFYLFNFFWWGGGQGYVLVNSLRYIDSYRYRVSYRFCCQVCFQIIKKKILSNSHPWAHLLRII